MTHTTVGEQDKAILTDTYAELNPAAIQRQIQALTAQLLILTTSKAAATTKPAVQPTAPQEPVSTAEAAQLEIFFTRSRPYKKNDQATVESKNNHLVRKYGFYYRYDTDAERRVLNRLWPLVNDRLNYLTPTKKPVGYGTDRNGRRTRLYDAPTTPLDRLLAAKGPRPAAGR
jgi:hypothetical protein